MKKSIALAVCAIFAATCTAHADVQVDAATQQRVRSATTEFFAHLSTNDYAQQYEMMSPGLKSQLPFERWVQISQELAVAMNGTPTNFQAHRSTYYNQDGLAAAVDFSAQGNNPDQLLCGFIVWNIGEGGSIILARIEQNLADGVTFRKMPLNEAAQLMANWYCPVPLIEQMLNIKIQ